MSDHTPAPGAGPETSTTVHLPERRARRRGPGPGPRVPGLLSLGPLLLLTVWFVGSATGLIEERTLSAPWTVARTAADLISAGTLQEHLLASAGRALLGLGVGVTTGLALALVAGLSRIGEGLVDGPMQINRAVPNLALLPLLILWFGIGEEMKVITIALAVVVPIYVHTHNALSAIDQRYVELAETLGTGRATFIGRVVLPGALPGFLLGLRFAVTAAWLSLVVVEQVNSTNGLGYMMTLAGSYGQTDVIVVGLVVYAVLGLLLDGLVRLVQRRALTWRRTLEG
ncbi:ABC transporter permease [Nocardiopsis alba]|uniref:ABC transporter permease n=1 Tax=Nocardiopsis alba TaxID=53437 RepID=UPI0036512C00